MGIYTYSVSNTAMNTSNDLMTLIAAANRRVQIVEVIVGGMGTTSAAGEVRVSRSTGGTTGGGALTGQKAHSDLPTAASTVNTTWSAQPSLSGDPIARIPVNQNGGLAIWRPTKPEEAEFRNSEQISIRPAVGTHNVTVTVRTREDP